MRDLSTCAEECFRCIKSYKKKHSLIQGQPFDIKCGGIPSEYIPLEILKDLPEEERLVAQAMVDPVAWAAQTLDWHCLDPDGEIWKRKNPDEYYAWLQKNPTKSIEGSSRYHRPYQAEMLRCQALRKVFRIGRQCLASSARVHLKNGTTKSIRDIKVGDQVLSLKEESNTQTYSKVIDHWSSGVKKIYKVKTKFGHEIECSNNHPFLVINKTPNRFAEIISEGPSKEWRSINEGLSVGTKIAVPTIIKNLQANESVGDLAPFLGYFLSDGSASIKQSAKFTNINIDYLLEFEELSKNLGTNVKWYKKGKGYDLIITNGRSKSNPVRTKLKDLGLTDITGPDKFIPECIFTAPLEEVRLFINRFWSGDGYVSTFGRTGRKTFRTEIGILEESLTLLKQMQSLLLRFGAHGYIKAEKNCHRLVISNKHSVRNFLNNVGPIFGKEEACEKALENIKTISDKYLHTTGDILWDYVSSIEESGEEETWDIEVEETHNFIANGMHLKNSGKTESLVISMLYAMFTKPSIPKNEGFEIILITPYQAQIDLIFTRMMQLIRSSSITQNSLKRHVKAPMYSIQLHNDSKVTGFTAGTKSGGNADAVRGQHGHMLVFDEADYLSSADIDSALSIITNYPNATVWMSSTPSGRRERFFQTCGSKIFKEYHYTSQVNPMWNDDLENLFREQLTETGYKHEILAEFGEQEQGVFQNSYVQAAKSNYSYGDYAYNNRWTYTIGVDWNDVKNGTTISVLGFNPSERLFYVVDRYVVSREGWTQLSACNKIAELNRIWRPLIIYIDAGFGGTQYEILRKYGYDSLADPTKGPTHPDSKLRDIVKKYDFGSKVDVHDLFTKRIISKPAKPFLVENTVRRFESNDIRFPEGDEKLEAQLQGYIIDRITASGSPVYKAGDASAGDHSLDALMLSVVGFTLEATPLGKPKYETGITFSGKLGEGVEPLIHEGDTVIHSGDRREKNMRSRDQQKPSPGRDSVVNKDNSLLGSPDKLPASNTNKGRNSVSLWSWSGFGHDAPKPKVRTLAEAEREAGRRLGIRPKSANKPSRKNI